MSIATGTCGGMIGAEWVAAGLPTSEAVTAEAEAILVMVPGGREGTGCADGHWTFVDGER